MPPPQADSSNQLQDSALEVGRQVWISRYNHGMPTIEVQTVVTPKHSRDFFSLRRKIYANDSSVIHPLKSMERLLLNPAKHPFYEHASREMFVAYRDSELVGRVVAIKDTMHNEHYNDQVGFFGFFETVDDQAVADALLNAAEGWLKEQGCNAMRGPVSPSMKGEFGVLTEGHEYSPMIMMGYTPKRYATHLAAAKFDAIKTFYAIKFNRDEIDGVREKWKQLYDAREKIFKRYPQLEIRQVAANNFQQTFREINTLGNTVRSEGWGFVPLTEKELEFMIKNIRRVIRFDMIHVAYWEGKLVGYIVNIPDINWALKQAKGKWDWLRLLQFPFYLKRSPQTRVIALGVDKQYRTKGIAMILISLLVDTFKEYETWEFSWVDADNLKSLRAIERSVPLVKYKTYQLFEKAI